MSPVSLRKWIWVHKWASLVCTIFLLITCLTGLPLIFSDEIAEWLDDGVPYDAVDRSAARVNLDRIVAASRELYPGEIVIYLFVDDEKPKVTVYLARSWEQFHKDRKTAHWIRFDAHSGRVLKRSLPSDAQDLDVMSIALRLHRDMFAGLAGELFMGLMAILFVVAILSGVAIYGPFMRRLHFGTVRHNRSARIKWLDRHNMLGVVTLSWLLVVGVTGLINELSTPLFALWQRTDVKAALDPFKGQPASSNSDLSSVQSAFETAAKAVPDMTVVTIIFPGAEFGTPYHYLFWAKGQEPLTSRLFSPILVNAGSGRFEGALEMPWYLRALQVSRPLHFGDYGGLPFKVIWALLDVITIVILGSGIYLWFSRASTSQDIAGGNVVARSNGDFSPKC